jgi:hypothetical protein
MGEMGEDGGKGTSSEEVVVAEDPDVLAGALS